MKALFLAGATALALSACANGRPTADQCATARAGLAAASAIATGVNLTPEHLATAQQAEAAAAALVATLCPVDVPAE